MLLTSVQPDEIIESNAWHQSIKACITRTSRRPSHYLTALLKFESERKTVIETMFGDDDSADFELSLDVVLAPLIQLASLEKKRCAYKTAEPPIDNHYRDCGKRLTMSVDFLHTSSSIGGIFQSLSGTSP